MFDWGDIPIFLALARHGTTGKAAAALGCSQPTVVRRIAAFERSVGLDLFVRDSRGFALTEAGQALLDACHRSASAMQGVADCIEALREERSERIRVTIVDQFEALLTPVVRDFKERWPDAQVQLLTSYRRFDLAAGEADIALRAGIAFGDGEVLTRTMPDGGWGIYVAGTLAEDQRPDSLADIANFPVAGGDGNLALLPSLQWFEGLAGRGRVAIHCNNFASVRSAILDGAIGMLPCVAGGSDPALVPLFAPIRHLMVPLYLGVRREALRRPAVRDLFEALTVQIEGKAALIGGDCPPSQQGPA